MCSRPLARARSVPGSGCRCRAALRAVAVRRGSTTKCCAPRSRPASKYCMAGGIVSAGLLPTRTTTSASAMSLSGNGMPAVQAERPVGRARGRGHAEAAVVVDGAGAQRDPGELAELVGLLVGQRPAAEAADGVAAVPRLGALDRVDQPAEGVVPGGLDERAGAVARRRADQRAEQPLGVVEQLGRRPALGAQAALVGREVGRHEGGRAVAGGDVHAALQGAVGAVGQRRPRRADAAGGGLRGGGGGHASRVCRRRFPSTAPASTLRSVVLTASARRLFSSPGWSNGAVTAHRPTVQRIDDPDDEGPDVRPAEQRDVPRIAATLTIALADSRWTRWALPDDGRMQRLTRLHELDAGHRGVATRTAWVTDDVTAVAVWEPPAGAAGTDPLPADVRAALARELPYLAADRAGAVRDTAALVATARPVGAALVAGPPGRPADLAAAGPGGRGAGPGAGALRRRAACSRPPPSTAGRTSGSCAASASRSPRPPGRRTTSCRCGCWCGSLSGRSSAEFPARTCRSGRGPFVQGVSSRQEAGADPRRNEMPQYLLNDHPAGRRAAAARGRWNRSCATSPRSTEEMRDAGVWVFGGRPAPAGDGDRPAGRRRRRAARPTARTSRARSTSAASTSSRPPTSTPRSHWGRQAGRASSAPPARSRCGRSRSPSDAPRSSASSASTTGGRSPSWSASSATSTPPRRRCRTPSSPPCSAGRPTASRRARRAGSSRPPATGRSTGCGGRPPAPTGTPRPRCCTPRPSRRRSDPCTTTGSG